MTLRFLDTDEPARASFSSPSCQVEDVWQAPAPSAYT